MKTVGERIRQARLARGMSGEALALKVGYKTQSGISNLEARSNGSGGHKVGAIAQALNVPLDWLLNGPDSDTIPSVAQSTAELAAAEPGAGVYSLQTKAKPDTTGLDPWTREAVEIFSKLREHEKQGALAQLRTFVHNLGPPRDGQALSVAGN